MGMVSEKTIGRLSLYRRLLGEMRADGIVHVFSHDLAARCGGSAAQVRRDLMAVGCTGSPAHGYEVDRLTAGIARYLDGPGQQPVALVGVGNLGRALLAYFAGRRASYEIVASFDKDPALTNRVIHGCRCYPVDRMGEVLEAEGVRVAVIAVPAGEAQTVADQLVEHGVRGILNYAPAPLQVPPTVFVEQMDMTMALEKVAFFARDEVEQKEGVM